MSSVLDEGGYGRFGAYLRVELERFFHLDDEDRWLIRAVPIDPPPALPQSDHGGQVTAQPGGERPQLR
jgi:hypothetical protein